MESRLLGGIFQNLGSCKFSCDTQLAITICCGEGDPNLPRIVADNPYHRKIYTRKSSEAWLVENPKPASIFAESSSLKCAYCDKELLPPTNLSIIVIWTKNRTDYHAEKEHFHEIYWCCKGHCDSRLAASRQNCGYIDGWEDIHDVAMPTVYIKWVMTIANELRAGVTYSDEAFEQLKQFMLELFPYVSRHLTSKEKDRVKNLMMIPSFLAGLGD